jgi:hypothetical protein
MILLGRDEDLGLVGQAAEGLAVDDAVAVALEIGAQGAFRLGAVPAAALGGAGRPGGQCLQLQLLGLLPDGHCRRREGRNGGPAAHLPLPPPARLRNMKALTPSPPSQREYDSTAAPAVQALARLGV